MMPATDTNQNSLRSIDLALAAFLKRQFPAASAAHCQLAALLSLQLQAGHTCLPLDNDASRQLVRDCCGAPLETLLADNPLIGTDASLPLVRDDQRLYLNRYWQLETRIAAQLACRLLNHFTFSAEEVREPLAQLFADSDTTPNWQQLACLLTGRKGVGIITGGPGTGKTTTVVRLLALMQWVTRQRNEAPLRIRLAAPTGKAAARLNESIRRAVDKLPVPEDIRASLPTQVITLHRLLGYQPGTRHFRHHARNPLAADLVVVDEASMIDIDQFVQLLDALPATCRLVLVGDKDQLASVDAGAVMSDLCQHADQPAYDAETQAFIKEATGLKLDVATGGSALMQQTVKLQHNWRAKDAPGITLLAQAINQQQEDKALHAFNTYPQQLRRVTRSAGWIKRELIEGDTGLASLLQGVAAVPTNASTTAVDEWARQLLAQLGQQQLLTPLRQGTDGVDGLNAAIIEQLFRAGLISKRHHFAGLPLLVTRNLHELELMNGDLGLLLWHPLQQGLRVAFHTDKGMRWLLPEQLEGCSQSAFALSVHKSQGSEFKRVLLHLPERPSPLLTRELVYTAVTRASAEFVLLEGDTSLLATAMRQRTQRYSGLAERLHG